jgi:hypothetical protein
MATSKSTLINWFKRGLKPLATQFEAWINSYWHKDEAIPMASVDELISTLNSIGPDTIAALRDGVPTQGNTLNKLYNLITSVGELVGEHDASTGLPTTGSGEGGAIDKGDYWFITTPGTIAGLGDLAVGDVLFAKQADADEASEFFYLPFASIVGDASDTEKGIVELADIDEAVAGTDGNRVITPLTLTAAYRTSQSTGDINFSTPRVYGTESSPVTGNLTHDLTNARLGFVQKIYHEDSAEPTYPSGWVKIAGEYVADELNLIFAEFCGSGRVEYFIINQDAAVGVRYADSGKKRKKYTEWFVNNASSAGSQSFNVFLGYENACALITFHCVSVKVSDGSMAKTDVITAGFHKEGTSNPVMTGFTRLHDEENGGSDMVITPGVTAEYVKIDWSAPTTLGHRITIFADILITEV